jgi:hypothetical protein
MSGSNVSIPTVVVRVEQDHAVSPRALDAALRARIERTLRERSREFVATVPGRGPQIDTARLQALVADAIEQALAEGAR